MEINKIIYKKSVLTIVYEDGGSIFTLKTEDSPGEKMLACLGKLDKTLMRALGFKSANETSKDYENVPYREPKISAVEAERLAVASLFSTIGLTYSWSEKNGSSYRIFGSLAGNVLKTAPMRTPAGSDYWDGKDPRDFPDLLTPEDKETIDILLNETENFVLGARDQLELFNNDGEATEEADNGGEE